MAGKSTVYALDITLPTAYNSTWRCAVAMMGSDYFNKANTIFGDLCNAVAYERVNNSTIKCSSWFSKTFIFIGY